MVVAKSRVKLYSHIGKHRIRARRWQEAKLDVIEKQFKVDLEMEKFKFTSSHCVEIGGATTCAELRKQRKKSLSIFDRTKGKVA